jgi:hypothetical protein
MWTAGGVIFAAICAMLGVVYTAKKTHQSNQENYSVSLIGRIERLEQDMEKTRKGFSLAINFIERVAWVWGDINRGSPNPKPFPTPPKELHEFLDPSVWEGSTSQEVK